MNLDIRPGPEYHSDERNKIFSFSKKATLKATTLGICMCSAELRLWKNQKGSTRYSMILCKWDSNAAIFLWTFKFFSDKLISQNSSKPLIVRSFYLLRMSDDYCFHRAAQRQLSQCNRRNTATVLRAVVKSHNGLKGRNVFTYECSGRNLKNLLKYAGKSPCWGLFMVKVQPVIAYKRLLGQLYQKATLSKALL